jgi:hypothetical protein
MRKNLQKKNACSFEHAFTFQIKLEAELLLGFNFGVLGVLESLFAEDFD